MSGLPTFRSLVAAALAGLILLATALVTLPDTAVGSNEELREARSALRETRERIRTRAHKLRVAKKELNRLATRIARNEARVYQTGELIAKLEVRIARLEIRLYLLQQQLDERSRAAYILGPGTAVLYLLTATSTEDVASRMSFLSEMNRRDALLANRVGNIRDRVATDRAQRLRLQRVQELALEQLDLDREELRRKLAESRKLFAQLKDRRQTIIDEISRIRPFAVCPVQGPHAISDSFGIFVHRSEKRGGDHVHQGNDISAPTGTPVVAPFDGTAVTARNKMGGLAVKVYGDYGYVYNAHLSRYGRLGPVEKGDVIGYVGSTGNALGPHNHFEWHPGNGKAADPYHFLLLVC